MKSIEGYVSDETYAKLKKVGFNWDYWNRLFSPFKHPQVTLACAQKWLREYTDGHVIITPHYPDGTYHYEIMVRFESDENPGWFWFETIHHGMCERNTTYEEALEAGINKALDLMITGKKGNRQ